MNEKSQGEKKKNLMTAFKWVIGILAVIQTWFLYVAVSDGDMRRAGFSALRALILVIAFLWVKPAKKSRE